MPMVARRRICSLSRAKLGFQIIEDALRQLGGFVGLVDVGLHQGELVATEAGEGAEAATVGAAGDQPGPAAVCRRPGR